MSTASAVTIIQQARSQNRLLLTEVEAKTLLDIIGNNFSTNISADKSRGSIRKNLKPDNVY